MRGLLSTILDAAAALAVVACIASMCAVREGQVHRSTAPVAIASVTR